MLAAIVFLWVPGKIGPQISGAFSVVSQGLYKLAAFPSIPESN